VASSYVRYAAGAVGGLGVQLAVMHVLSHFHYAIAASLGIAAGTLVTFLSSQLWAFARR
jgi:putative flippase GtrA